MLWTARKTQSQSCSFCEHCSLFSRTEKSAVQSSVLGLIQRINSSVRHHLIVNALKKPTKRALILLTSICINTLIDNEVGRWYQYPHSFSAPRVSGPIFQRIRIVRICDISKSTLLLAVGELRGIIYKFGSFKRLHLRITFMQILMQTSND